MRVSVYAATLLAVAAAGCADSTAKLKGRLLEGGQPVNFAGHQTGLSFHLLTDGKTDPNWIYPAAVAPDGTFEMLASGGTLPPGRYRVQLESWGSARGGPLTDRFGGRFSKDRSRVECEVTPGRNDLMIDLPPP